MLDWNLVRRCFASFVTVAASSVTLLLPFLISNPNDGSIEAAGYTKSELVRRAAGEPTPPTRVEALPTAAPNAVVQLPAVEGPLKLMSFLATAYSLRGNTSSGVEARRGIVAADPDVLPLGSIIRIHSPHCAGIYTVLDTGANLRGRIIDIYMPIRKQAIQFGSRRVKVEIIRSGWTPEVAEK